MVHQKENEQKRYACQFVVSKSLKRTASPSHHSILYKKRHLRGAIFRDVGFFGHVNIDVLSLMKHPQSCICNWQYFASVVGLGI